MKRRRKRKVSWRTSQAKLKVMRTWTRICGERRRRRRKTSQSWKRVGKREKQRKSIWTSWPPRRTMKRLTRVMRKGKERRKKMRKKMSLRSSTTIRPIPSMAKIRIWRNQKLLIFPKTWTWMTKNQRITLKKITLKKLQLMSLRKCQTLKMRLKTRRKARMKKERQKLKIWQRKRKKKRWKTLFQKTRRRTWIKTIKTRMPRKKRNQGTKRLNPEWISMKRMMIKKLSSRKAILTRTKKSKGDEGMNDESRQNTEDKKSFGVKGNEDEKEEEPKKQEAGSGTESQEERSLAENMSNSEIERLEVVEGSATEEEGKQSASVFRHVMDEKEEDKSALDKMKDQEDVKEQVLPKDWDTNKPEEKEEKVARKKEEEREKDKKKSSKGGENNMEEEEEREEKEEERSDAEFTRTYDVARGAESLAVRREMDEVVVNRSLEELPDSISLQPITLTDQEGEEGSQGVAQLSHQLCEQLRLILEPPRASKLQGDFRTGKRLNMRKIIPYIASQFKKDKIWLRRVKPNKREFQIAVALDDSSSMADNKSRTLALQALATISSALSLLEAGQLGVIRFGAKAEIVHGLDQQWGAQAGRRVEGQFGFEQKETSMVSLLNLATALFTSRRGQAARGLAVSQLLVIVSDGRGIFHEGKEKVRQAVMRARQAGYFCLFLIVENPENKDSVLDIRLPVFKEGQLASIDSYMEHFPFQHYIVLRDVETLPHTLSDSLRQWFELVTS